MTTKQAISAIVTYNTLPPQIDFTLPWRLESIEAEKYLDTLPGDEIDKANAEIKKQIEAYYEPNESGQSAAYYDSLF